MTTCINTQLFVRYLGILFIAGAFLVPKVFAAEPTDGVRTETVKFEDLAVNSPAGAAALYARIHRAAQAVCVQPGTDGRNLRSRTTEQTCMAQSESRAVKSVNSGALSAYYQSKVGHPSIIVATNVQ
jgi:UrcA family protein